MTIHIENPDKKKLEELDVASWAIWEKEISEFPWYYDETEMCYILEGHAIVTPKDGTAVEIKAGDLVTFSEGLSCSWNITQSIKKHYYFI
jgi:uncharacterized protein